jgi:uncharacterized protein (TIGR03083 family)
MTLPREDIESGIVAEHRQFAELIRSISREEWTRPSRCAGWSVGDVAAHVVGTMSDIVAGRLEGQGTEEVTARQVEERRGRSAGELADELEGASKVAADMLRGFDDAAWSARAPGGYDGPLGEAVETLWYDAYLHADDMRAALGRPSQRGPGLRASVSHVATMLERRGWGPATLALDGVEEMTIGGGGKRVTGDALAFVLAATGRADPATLGLDSSVNLYA